MKATASAPGNWLELNRRNGHARVHLHVRSGFYEVPGFLAGKESLRDFEPAEVGEVRGRALLHLQCHIGLDTLSWARRGAIVTGLDVSQPAAAVFSICVPSAPSAARTRAGEILAGCARVPGCRDMLAAEGGSSPGDIAVIGDERELAIRLEELAALGVTGVIASSKAARAGGEDRARAFLSGMARSGRGARQ